MILENVPKIVGVIYAIAGLFILAYLFYKDRFNKKIGYVFLLISTALGFLIFAPMYPVQLQLILLGDTIGLGVSIGMALIGIILFVVLTLIFGRLFCGYLCPIGAIQELFYLIPTPKKG
jgi:ferredoxin-type protein NapH